MGWKLEKVRPKVGRKAFAEYDKARFAVRIAAVGQQPLRGMAHFQRDDQLGNILRISLDGDLAGNPEIIVVEEQWNGLITSGDRYGCDFCLSLTEPC